MTHANHSFPDRKRRAKINVSRARNDVCVPAITAGSPIMPARAYRPLLIFVRAGERVCIRMFCRDAGRTNTQSPAKNAS